jgi:hypothetical protein
VKKKDSKEKILIFKDSRDESEKKEASEDGFNWKEVNIGKESDEINIETPNKTKGNMAIDNKEEDSGFSWENVSINKEPLENPMDPPELFDDRTEENSELEKGDHLNREKDLMILTQKKPRQDALVGDKKSFLITKKTNLGRYASYIPEARERGRDSSVSILKRFTSFLASLFIFVAIIFSIISIIVSLELVSKGKSGRFTNFILSMLPNRVLERLDDRIIVTEQTGKWVSTRNGFIYVVSGKIANDSIYDISFIKIKGEFSSDGKELFEQVVYAGNSFNDTELRTLPFEVILNRLQRKNGDINFNYPTKLAGLNYDIEPNETVPFFIVYPSETRVLGLKYNIRIVGFEKWNLKK